MTISVRVPRIVTPRLILRRPENRDRTRLIALADNWAVVKTLSRLPFPYRERDADFFFEQVVPNELNWAIALDDEFIGDVALRSADDREWFLGYWIGEPFWGLGYATEAAQAIVDWALAELEEATIISGCLVENEASHRVLRKLGFVESGRSIAFSMARRQEVKHRDMALPSGQLRTAVETNPTSRQGSFPSP